MDFVLVTTPDGRSSRHEIGSGTLRIGRSPTNDVVISDQYVSRSHAEIVRHPDGCYLVDVGAKSGIRLNGSAVGEPVRLSPGDCIQIGPARLVFQGPSEATVVFEDLPLPEGSGVVVPTPVEAAAPGREGFFTTLTPTGPGEAAAPPGAAPGSPLGLFAQADRELQCDRPQREIFEKVLDLAGQAVPFERGVLVLREGERWTQVAARTPRTGEPGSIPISRTMADRVLHRRESFLTTDALADDRFREGVSVVAQAIRSAICVPLWNNREVIGLLYVDSRQRSDRFTPESLEILAHLANLAAVRIENRRLFEKTLEAATVERELSRAAEIQRHLLPTADPAVPGYQVHGESIPCHAVGGDYFEYLQLPEGRIGIAVGDISGKGFAASLLMCSLQASLVSLAELGLPPQEVVVQLNRVLSRRFPESRFVTLFYGELDPARHTLTYVNAGHCPPRLLSGEAAPAPLVQSGRPVGLFEDSPYTAASVTFDPGDTLVLFTDGIPGSRSASGEWYGEDRIVDRVRDSAGAPAAARAVLDDVERFLEGKPREDDLTVVVLRRDP